MLTLLGSGLTGLGLGATVAPALLVAGWSLPVGNLQRVFALVELFRAVAAFMIAPIFVYFASTASAGLIAVTSVALWFGLGLTLGGGAVGAAVFAFSGASPQTPNLELFLGQTDPSWYAPPLLARIRSKAAVATLISESAE